MVGRRVENNLNNGKEMWFGFGASTALRSAQRGGYRSAKGRVAKKVKVKNGIW
jgi:hypothetical protein